MYCTQSDITTRRLPEATLLQLTDPEGTGQIDSTIVDGAISESVEIIDGYCRGGYQLPFVAVPGIIKAVAVDLAVYALYGRSPFDTPERVEKDRDAALALLGKIQSGKVQLGAALLESPAAESQGGMLVDSPSTIFSREKLGEY